MLKIAIVLALIFNSFGSLYVMDIWTAVMNGNTKQVEQLIQQDNTLVSAQSYFKWTPLHYASISGNTQTAALLLQHNADVNAQDDSNWTPLHRASRNGYTKTIKLLLSHGATPHKPINLFVEYPHYRQTYAQRYESWICKTFLSRKTIALLLSLIGRKQITDIPLLPKDMRNLIANYALADEVQEWENSKKKILMLLNLHE